MFSFLFFTNCIYYIVIRVDLFLNVADKFRFKMHHTHFLSHKIEYIQLCNVDRIIYIFYFHIIYENR